MVLLLEAGGVKTTAELAKKESRGLTAAIATANQTKKITEKPPDRAAAAVLDRRGEEVAASSGIQIAGADVDPKSSAGTSAVAVRKQAPVVQQAFGFLRVLVESAPSDDARR